MMLTCHKLSYDAVVVEVVEVVEKIASKKDNRRYRTAHSSRELKNTRIIY